MGTRLNPEARAVQFQGRSIDQMSATAIDELRRWLDAMTFDPAQEPVARPLVREITGRLAIP